MPSSTCQALLIAAALLSAVAVAGAARPVSTAAVLSSGAVLLAADAEAPVQVTLYAEALCPYCAAFLTDILHPLLESGFEDIVEFHYIAWGNARNVTGKGVMCQHGPAECLLDRVISCATHQAGSQADWLPFVLCLEGSDREKMEDAVDGCAEDAGLDAAALHECAEGPQGDELEREAAEETAKLRPPHQYVPWVVVNGVPMFDDFDKLKLVVCAAYGGERPDACYAPPKGPSAGELPPQARQQAPQARWWP